MILDAASILLGAAALGGGLFLSFLGGMKEGRKALTEPEICAGYLAANAYEGMKRDCLALRSAICLDGRCGFHCGKLCKCDRAGGVR